MFRRSAWKRSCDLWRGPSPGGRGAAKIFREFEKKVLTNPAAFGIIYLALR